MSTHQLNLSETYSNIVVFLNRNNIKIDTPEKMEWLVGLLHSQLKEKLIRIFGYTENELKNEPTLDEIIFNLLDNLHRNNIIKDSVYSNFLQ
jgi:hypothetical protein